MHWVYALILFVLYTIIVIMQQFDLRDYIKFKRTKMGFKLNKFAIENEIDQSILSRLENKKFDLKYPVLEKIARGFSMSPGEFLLEYENCVKAMEKTSDK